MTIRYEPPEAHVDPQSKLDKEVHCVVRHRTFVREASARYAPIPPMDVDVICCRPLRKLDPHTTVNAHLNP